jgi:hypothetical protein
LKLAEKTGEAFAEEVGGAHGRRGYISRIALTYVS